MFGINFLVSIYYNVLMAYTFYYLFASFTSYLPWSENENKTCPSDCTFVSLNVYVSVCCCG